MAFKLRSGNKPEFKNMGSSPAMQKNNKEKKSKRIESMYRSGGDFEPAYPGADYSKEQIAKMTEAEKIAKIDGYVPKKDKKEKTGKPTIAKKAKTVPGKQEMTLEERRAKHKADNKKKTDAAVEKHRKAMRKKQLKAYKERGTVFIDKKTGKTIAMQKTKPIKPLQIKQPEKLMEGLISPKMEKVLPQPQLSKKKKKKNGI